MSKRKHPEHVNHERWLVSYADFITLLFAFFVVLFASGQTDKRKQVKLAHAMEAAFLHDGIFDPHSRTPPISDDSGAVMVARPTPVALPIPSSETSGSAGVDGAGAGIEQHIRAVIEAQTAEHKMAGGMVSVRPVTDGLAVSLRESGFFASGSAEVRPEALAALSAVASALPRGSMRVEGHTDNVPIHTAQFATNWELSTARAATITRLLIAQGAVAPALVSAAGYAEFQPVEDNRTEAGRAENRRVDIILLRGPVRLSPPVQGRGVSR